MSARYAIVEGFNSERELKAYLPSNYSLVGIWGNLGFIAGFDNAGWTLDGYVIPRLSSGNMGCRELVSTPF
jgi:hypothetical protein